MPDDGFKYLRYAFTGLSAGTDDVFRFASYEVDDFVFHLFRHGIGHVYLVDDGDDFQIMVDGHIEIGNSLCLYALGRIHDEQCSFAGCNAPRDLIGEVDVSRRVNKIQNIFLLP